VSGVSLLATVREVQVPILAVLLICGCAAKARHATATGRAAGPTSVFPPWLRRPAAIALCATEFLIGAARLRTAGRAGAGDPALSARVAAVLLFGTATATLNELRARRPDAGCGCFGDLSSTPVSWRVILRAMLLCAAALAAIGTPPLRMPATAQQAWLMLAVMALEVILIAALSPEIGQIMLRLSHSDPCELREVPVTRTLAALQSSHTWRRYRPFLTASAPADVWREGCWRFVVFPGALASRRVDVVFAVHLADRGAPVKVGLLDADGALASSRDTPLQDTLQLYNLV
jgi:hypothetical protein